MKEVPNYCPNCPSPDYVYMCTTDKCPQHLKESIEHRKNDPNFIHCKYFINKPDENCHCKCYEIFDHEDGHIEDCKSWGCATQSCC